MSNRASNVPAAHRLLTAGVMLMAVSGGLVACSSSGGGSGSGSASSNSGTVTVQMQQGPENAKEFGAVIRAFKKQYPRIKVNTVIVPNAALIGSNLTVLTSSNPPDVAQVPINSTVYSRMLQAKQLVPLNDVWQKDNLSSVYPPAVAATLKSNGTPYVVNYHEVYYCVVYYNTALFKRLGIPVPANHRLASIADLVKIVKVLRAHGYQGLAYGPADGYESSWQIDSFLPGTASKAQLANYMSSWQPRVPVTAKYTDPAFVHAVAGVQTLGKDGVYQDGYLGQKVAQAESLFVQQKAGMLLDGSWAPAALGAQGLKFQMGWMLLPSLNPSLPTPLLSYNGDALGIPVQAAHQALAKKFLEFIMSPKGQANIIQGGELPVTTTVPASVYKGLPAIVQDELAYAKANGSLVGWTSAVPGGLGQAFTDPLVQAMLNGQMTPQAVGAKVQAQLQVIRSGH